MRQIYMFSRINAQVIRKDPSPKVEWISQAPVSRPNLARIAEYKDGDSTLGVPYLVKLGGVKQFPISWRETQSWKAKYINTPVNAK